MARAEKSEAVCGGACYHETKSTRGDAWD
jgi:hypothetical protein